MRHTQGLVVGALASVIGITSPAAGADSYLVGVAKVEITPKEPIWMSGYGNRNKPSEGVDQPLYLKAFAIQVDKEQPLVLETADILGFPGSITEEIADRLQKEAQLPRANFMTIASHTHTPGR
jgi:hypothetical protein